MPPRKDYIILLELIGRDRYQTASLPFHLQRSSVKCQTLGPVVFPRFVRLESADTKRKNQWNPRLPLCLLVLLDIWHVHTRHNVAEQPYQAPCQGRLFLVHEVGVCFVI